MKRLEKLVITITILFINLTAYSQTIDDYIKKAESYNRSGDTKQAAKVMEEAIQKYPNNSTAHSYLGLYSVIQAGKTQDFAKAGKLFGIAYEMMDKAVALDADNPIARLHRGLLGVKVPDFLNKLDQGIQDLELLIEIHEKSPDRVSIENLAEAYNFLGEGYLRREKNQKAISAWKKVIEIAPGTTLAQEAQNNLLKVPKPKAIETGKLQKSTSYDLNKYIELTEKEPDDSALLAQLGKAYHDTQNFEEANKVLRKAIQKDSANVEAYKLLIQTISAISGQAYDERIYKDTNYRLKFVFDLVKLSDKAVEIAPDDMELRLIRGKIGAGLPGGDIGKSIPIFAGKFEQAIDDLNLVRQSDASNEIKAEALYWLGMAYQKKATIHWKEVIADYPNTDAFKLAFESMQLPIKHFDPAKYKKPFVVVDFYIGFRDELPPQTVVWIEDKDGRYVNTLYVSGFSGFVKEKQSHLAEWAKSSDFRDIDAVTSASVNVGRHFYVWDLKDHNSEKVRNGEYVVKVEICYTFRMEYQLVSAAIEIGKKASKTVVEEGNFIPYLEVMYYSDKN